MRAIKRQRSRPSCGRPVVVSPYSAEWPHRFQAVREELLSVFAPVVVAVEHSGSTAVPGLAAKPVIDVLLGSRFWREHLAFRDALRADSVLRSEYQSLKLRLAQEFADDKAAYTDAKGPFIRSVVAAVCGGTD